MTLKLTVISGIHFNDLLFELANTIRLYRWSIKHLEVRPIGDGNFWDIRVTYDEEELAAIRGLEKTIKRAHEIIEDGLKAEVE